MDIAILGRFKFVFLLTLAFSPTTYASTLQAYDITDLILVTGQSNVRGSNTDYDATLDAVHLQVFAYTNQGDWEIADLHQAWDVDGKHPGNESILDPTKDPNNNFAFHFAKTVVQNEPARVVGLIMAAAPGEGILHWDDGQAFANIVDAKVLAALNAHGVKSKIDGILWHQGETDWNYSGTRDPDATAVQKNAPDFYPNKLNTLIQTFRAKSWFDDSRPFICGETKQAPVNVHLNALNFDGDNWTGCVAATDLPTREMILDRNPPWLGTHFDAEGLRILGQRYANLYTDLVNQSGANDSVKPITQVTSPISGSTFNPGLVDIQGTAFDNASGVSRVRVQVRRIGVSPLQVWIGSSWGTQLRYVDANVNADGTWTLPDVDLTGVGQYRIFSSSIDNAGNLATWADNPIIAFTVKIIDVTKPNTQIQFPVTSSYVTQGLTSISGTASDSESGVDKVWVQVRKLNSNPVAVWNGNAWGSTAHFVEANLDANGAWELPGINLDTLGSYSVFLRAIDRQGNLATWSDNPTLSFNVQSLDIGKPNVEVLTPSNGSTLNSGTRDIVGVASDNGSGVSAVWVQVRNTDTAPFTYWTGSVWTTTPQYVVVNVSDAGSWTLPDVDLSVQGRHRIYLVGFDHQGNRSSWLDNPSTQIWVQ